MQKRLVVAALMLAVTVLPLAAQSKQRWRVVSNHATQARILRQVRELAAQEAAVVVFSHGVSERARRAPAWSLMIELKLMNDPQAFLRELRSQAAGSAVEPTLTLAEEGYILRCSYRKTALAKIHITAASSAGLHYALLRVPDLIVTPPSALAGRLIPRVQALRHDPHSSHVTIADYPSFPIRGIVEGFYGAPWSHKDRLDVLAFEGQHGMNIYIYAPKDDPYHRKLWREPYPPEQMQQLSALVAAAQENFVHFTFAISPGLSMVYSSDAEFQALVQKVASIRNIGVTDFALLLDDVPQDLVHPEDRTRFATLAQAHASLINRLYAYLKSLSPQNRLMACPTTYTNEWGNREYLQQLGAAVNPDVPLHWTGTEVIPETITVAQAKQWAEIIKRAPLVWDNYPVNDGRTWRLFLQPLQGREPALPSAIAGLFSNPMLQAHASMIPLQTIADYLWNPAAYEGSESRLHAIVSQYGPDAPNQLAPILQMYDSEQQVSNVATLFSEGRSAIDVPAIENQVGRLESALVQMKQHSEFSKLVPEIEPAAAMIRDQLQKVRQDAAFKPLPDGKLQWDIGKHLLLAKAVAPKLDGDFSKWHSGPVYELNRASQLQDGENLWKGPEHFSARVALGWDEGNVYVGVDVTTPEIYQKFCGRGIDKGDTFRLVFDTLDEIRSGRPTGVYDLYLSPGNFVDTKPSVYSSEDFFPPRPSAHNYDQEIKTVWKRTATGYSADIAIPAAFFGKAFGSGQQIRLSFGAVKTVPSEDGDQGQIVFTSKEDKLFPVEAENPATLQQLVLLPPTASR